MKTKHPSTEAILRHFDHTHLPEELAMTARPLCKLAHTLAEQLDGPELTAGLRKLLEAKDCFVRASITVSNPHSSVGSTEI